MLSDSDLLDVADLLVGVVHAGNSCSPLGHDKATEKIIDNSRRQAGPCHGPQYTVVPFTKFKSRAGAFVNESEEGPSFSDWKHFLKEAWI